jgi:ABC-type histidine transport system ATPase subunit
VLFHKGRVEERAAARVLGNPKSERLRQFLGSKPSPATGLFRRR